MLALDLDELATIENNWIFSVNQSALLQFKTSDYFDGVHDLSEFKQRIEDKVTQLGGIWNRDKIIMLTQVRCLGLYFSPVNFYYCYENDKCKYLLAEVSNTPWNEKHYYLVPFENISNQPELTPKAFHVSPFMTMDMGYRWKLTAPKSSVSMHIENIKNDYDDKGNPIKVFDATFGLKKQSWNERNLKKILLRFPAMTLSIVVKIYWQAFKMFVLKGFKYIPHPNSRG